MKPCNYPTGAAIPFGMSVVYHPVTGHCFAFLDSTITGEHFITCFCGLTTLLVQKVSSETIDEHRRHPPDGTIVIPLDNWA